MRLIFLTHGWPKLTNGASGTAQFFGQLGIPAPGVTAWFITLLEFAGGAALILGALVSLLSVLFILHMATGVFVVHLSNGWYGMGRVREARSSTCCSWPHCWPS